MYILHQKKFVYEFFFLVASNMKQTFVTVFQMLQPEASPPKALPLMKVAEVLLLHPLFLLLQ